MYINSSYMPVATFLNQVHSEMIQKYTKSGPLGNANQMESNARELENFFRTLKMDAKNGSGNAVKTMINQQILSDIQQLHPNKKISKLFRREGGLNFEKELSDVIYSILAQVSDVEIEKNSNLIKMINVGSKTANIANGELESVLLDPTVQRILEQTGTKTKKYFQNNANKQLLYNLQDVSGKIDIQGLTVPIRGNPSPELLRIYNLLKNATFSAKNYGDFYWDRKLNSYQWSGNLRLGNTNVFRAFYGVLSDLKYRKPTIISAFQASWHEAERNPIVALRVNQIRFVYELIGAGLKYNAEVMNGHVKYLIYNDPGSDNIYVRSTAKIISDLLKTNQLGFSNPFTKMITIEKSYFHS